MAAGLGEGRGETESYCAGEEGDEADGEWGIYMGLVWFIGILNLWSPKFSSLGGRCLYPTSCLRKKPDVD